MNLAATSLMCMISVIVLMTNYQCQPSSGQYYFEDECDEPYACANGYIFMFDYSLLSCNGFASCLNSIFYNSTDDLYAYGALSCGFTQMDGLSGEVVFIRARGLFCLANADIDLTNDNSNGISASGALAGIGATITSDNDDGTIKQLDGTGFGSLANIDTSDSDATIRGLGYFSFANSQIRIENNGELTGTGRLSFYGANVTCPDGYTCDVECNTPTTCYGMIFTQLF